MATDQLARLERVDLRSVWANEASAFTPWLAKEENIALLGDALNLDLEVEGQEKNVGPFRADILCRDTESKAWVLIENQLEKTDHGHLGQLVTYAAGLNAETIIWIAEKFTEEHRAALDWLNQVTAEEFSFFGIEVELWRIASSPPAPKFNIVSKPNDWSKSVAEGKHNIADGDLTESQRLRLEYWTAFAKYSESAGGVDRPRKPSPQQWQVFSIGRTGFWLQATISVREKRITMALCLAGAHAKQHFQLLYRDRLAFEHVMGDSLDWKEMPDKKESHILVRWDNCDPADRTRWDEQHRWILEKVQKFRKAFAKAVGELDAEDASESSDVDSGTPDLTSATSTI